MMPLYFYCGELSRIDVGIIGIYEVFGVEYCSYNEENENIEVRKS